MTYQPRPNYDGRSPVADNERRHSPWLPQGHLGHRHSSSATPAAFNDIMEPESEVSDTPDADGEHGAFSFPISLPPAPSQQALDSKEALSAHLDELERVEDYNNRKHDRVKERRAQMDDRIMRKRVAQDAKIKAIIDARARRDERIKRRRAREDIAFQRFREEFDDEETRLRRRLKNLKRGLPIDDAQPNSRRASVNSMSPPGPSYSTVPPPAKRHQTSHPSHFETRPPNRGSEPNQYPPAPDRPSYQFYPSHHNVAPPGHYTQGPAYQPHPHGLNPVMPSSARMGPPPPDASPYGHHRPNGSPHISAPIPQQASSVQSTSETPPSRHPTASYDTRPPPPPTPPPGFAAVNHPPPQSGFAAVNSRPTETPSSSHAALVKDQHHKQHSIDQTPARASFDDEKTPAGSNSASKRTPSTTHPYQMSEAFANRHHHCERTDSLNRGIWTWYGPGGTHDRPTAPATEMYLVCNHDGCRRIDWRTVHGLQCHIVKNHEIPKGTIGSLEKALTAYGVPLSEIEEIERRNGIGSGGTMADPKNSKIKSRLRESAGTPLPVQKQYRPSDFDSPTGSAPQKNPPSAQPPSEHEPTSKSAPDSTPVHFAKQPEYRPSGGFAAVNTAWQGVNATPSKRPASPVHDTLAGPAVSKPTNHAVRESTANGTHVPFWSSWQGTNAPQTPQLQSILQKEELEQHSALPEVKPAPGAQNVSASASASTPGPQPDAAEVQTHYILDKPNSEEERQERSGSQPKILLEDGDIDDAENSVRDARMTGTEEEVAQTRLQSAPPAEQADRPSPLDANGDGMEKKDPEPVEKTEANKEEPKVVELDATPVVQSPEVSHRTRPSRRESRRTSVITAVSSKASTEKAKEEENEVASTTHTASMAGSTVDDDGDSITVNVAALKAERERKEEDDNMKTPPARRLPNGRFTRRTR
ncbi:hypothetical protein OHC33_000208 [Knufia fluminis]|uniref:Uncharacterized protein n=1 Tax=Knufia fluminis TaxID=191047 RepID=A0AAN8F1N8_9EURO|nr:hypothetical protein OHC33_000208 [Knufia fluminis]